MKTKNYKTLKGLVKATFYGIVTFNNLNSGIIYHKGAGWVRFSLAPSELAKAYDLLSCVVYRGAGKAYRLREYRGHEYGIFNRLWIGKDGRATYCAGQDYTSEIKTIQTLLRK